MRRYLPLLIAIILVVPTEATRQPVRARHGMVVAMESIAADVGVSALQKAATPSMPRWRSGSRWR